LVGQWLRAAKQDPVHRSACLTYAGWVTVTQIGWIGTAFLHTSIPVTFVLVLLLILMETTGPVVAETRMGGTPWHAHHVAERYGQFAIIALGEGMVGAVASLSAVVSAEGWSVDAVIVAVAGTALTFGMWWVYFTVPQADLLHTHRERSFWSGYFQLVVFGSIVATGAGLHGAADYIQHQSALTSVETVLAVAIPIGVYVASMYVLYVVLVRTVDSVHFLLVWLSAAVLAGAVLLADAGVSMANCLLVVMLAPMVTVVGYELVGHGRGHAAEGPARTIDENAAEPE
jgi:low temperature requirement protein LtrA